MKRLTFLSILLILAMVLAACGGAAPAAPAGEGAAAEEAAPAEGDAAAESETNVTVTKGSDVVAPQVVEPCGDDCPYEGQTVTVIVNAAGEKGAITGPIYEVRDEFEAATGATLEIVEVPEAEHFPKLMTDVSTGTGQYDTSIAGAWWLGDLVEGDFILPYDQWYNAEGFPQWDIEDVQPGPRSLLTYGDHMYMVANDHDGQVMYYRRDLIEDPEHQAAFEAEYGYPLGVPKTWDEFRDVAEYFDGKDLNGDGQPDDGLTLHLKVGGQGMFHFMSFAGPFVIGPDNPHLFWFDPETMEPLVMSPGHQRAMETLIDLTQFGPEAMMAWSLGESWDHFLRGEAALTFTWGDLGALAQEEGSQVKGKTGAAPMPGTMEYYDVTAGEWKQTDEPNMVGNTTGGSWAGVINKFSDAPEATYYLLALMATQPKSTVYAQRGWDGVDPGRFSHYLPPDGTASLDAYIAAGWDEQDVKDYTKAYFDNFGADLQFPYLRIPGAFEYWTALDIHLSEAATGQSTAEEALSATYDDYEAITDRLGRDLQKKSYLASLNLE
ncbi:MAG: ABC transporter substrate-binding protein [Caldilineaceae bacterium]|jgi:multiple sugar transport system substrate-binding protein